MKAWMIWGMILCIIVLLAFMKVGIFFAYSENNLTFKILIGKLRFQAGKGSHNKKKAVSETKELKQTKKSGKKNINPWVKSALHHWSEILSLVGKILTTPALDVLKLHVLVGSAEPDDSAMKYGRICSVVGGLLAPLENTFLVRKRDINIECSFDDVLQIDAEAVITLKLYEVIALLIAACRLLFAMYREINMNKKVVQNV